MGGAHMALSRILRGRSISRVASTRNGARAETARLIGSPLEAAGVLLLFVVLSHTVAASIDPRLPAAAVAMGFYLIWFALGGGPDAGTDQLYRGAAAVLPMLFVPVASGVVAFGGLEMDVWVLITLVVLGGTLTTLVSVGLLAERFLSKTEGGAR